MAERENLPHVIVRVATLDEDPHISAQQHIWTAHDVPWLTYENLPVYSEWQPNQK
jgi:ADP-ribosyl-[dinitrogen reductase] hydrolase